MFDLLPYELRTNVWATEYGIESTSEMNALFMLKGAKLTSGRKTFTKSDPVSRVTYLSWHEAKQLLEYRDGEPWCHDTARGILCVPSDETNDTWIGLHRLAAILCDDAEAFRVLYWCVCIT